MKNVVKAELLLLDVKGNTINNDVLDLLDGVTSVDQFIELNYDEDESWALQALDADDNVVGGRQLVRDSDHLTTTLNTWARLAKKAAKARKKSEE